MYCDPFKRNEQFGASAPPPTGMVVELRAEKQKVHIEVHAEGQQRSFSHDINLLAEKVSLSTLGKLTFLEISEQISKYYSTEQTIAFVAEHQLAIGRALFEAVFKPIDKDTIDWMEQFDGGLDSARGPLELLIRSTESALTNLPWPLLHFNKRYCFERLWQISLDYRSDTSRHAKILFPDTPRVLLACPEPEGLQRTAWQAHVDNLKKTLKPDGHALKQISFIDAGGRWSDVRKALKTEKYDILYYYGHGAQNNHGGAVLQFEDENRQPLDVPPTDLRLAILDGPSRPLLAYINCCNGAGDDLSNFGSGLIEAAAAVVSNRTVAVQDAAHKQALDFLSAITLGRESPQSAYAKMLRGLVESDLTMLDLRWMTPVLYRSFDKWLPSVSHVPSDWNIAEWQNFLNRDEEVREFTTGLKKLSADDDPSDALVYLAIGCESDGLTNLMERLQHETRHSGDNEASLSRVRTYHVSWPSEDSGMLDPTAMMEMLRNAIDQVPSHSISQNINAQIENLGGTRHKPAAMLLKFNLPQFAQPRSVQLFLKWLDMEAGKLFAGHCKGLICFSVECGEREQEELARSYQALLYKRDPADKRSFIARLFDRSDEKSERTSNFERLHLVGVFVLDRVLTHHVSDFVRSFHTSYARSPKSQKLPDFVVDFIEHIVAMSDGRHSRILPFLKDFNSEVIKFHATQDKDIR